MASMRQVLTYVVMWCGATALAILLVWFGARPVLHNAVFGEPPARPVVGDQPSVLPTATQEPSAPPADSSTFATPSRKPSHSAASSPSSAGSDRTYVIRGGRVVLAMTAASAHLVSATPNPDYEVRTWHSDGWLRVDFTKGETTSTLYATWNGHAPTVQVEG
jgi:hypothetical protein